MGLENPLHLVILLAIVLVVLGPKRLPQAGRALGHGMREFKDSITGTSSAEDDAPRPTQATPELPAPPPTVAADTADAAVTQQKTTTPS